MKKSVTIGDSLFLSVVIANYLRASRGKTDLKEVYKVCAYLDERVQEKSFQAFRKAYYRAKKEFHGVSLSVT